MNGMEQKAMTIGFQPAGNNVLVRLVPTDTEGLDNMVEWAEVIAVGPGPRTADGMPVAPDLAPGDRVALRPHTAVRLRLEGQALAIAGGSDVLGVLPGDAGRRRPQAEAVAAGPVPPAPSLRVSPAALAEESLETDVSPDLLDQESPTAEDLH
jgi:co-chaperonin GroES (HSP10)